MNEPSSSNTKQPATNEGLATPPSSQLEETKVPTAAGSEVACRTAGIHEHANVLLYAARVDLKSALESLPHPVEANDRVVAAKEHIKKACSLLPSLRLAHADLASQVCRSASPCPSLHRVNAQEREQGKYEINKLLQLVQEAVDWVECNKGYYDKICGSQHV